MFLLNSNLIRQYMHEQLILIDGFEDSMLHHVYYYFRIGEKIKEWDEERKEYQDIMLCKDQDFRLKPFSYSLIESLEIFSMSRMVHTVISQISDVAIKGLRLNHSVSVDPQYSGKLVMGLQNLLNIPMSIRCGQCVGKMYFYDISDSQPLGDIEDTISKDKFRNRSVEALGFLDGKLWE